MTLYAILKEEDGEEYIWGVTFSQSRALELVTLLTFRSGEYYGIEEISLQEGECFVTATQDIIMDIFYEKETKEAEVLYKRKIEED